VDTKTLNQQIDTAQQFMPDTMPVPQPNQQAQAQFGLAWAARQSARPIPEPIVTMPPIVPIAN
jgi:hypothetical protein